jgi:hypothetical protein
MATKAKVGPVTPPRRRKPGPKPSKPRRVLLTSFKAEGSIRSLAAQIYGGYHEGDAQYGKRKRRYAVLQSNHPPGYPDSPGVFTSVESRILGTVNFPGLVKLSTIIEMLNRSLSLDFKEVIRYKTIRVRGRNGKMRNKREKFSEIKRFRKAADFRSVYPKWNFKYQVVEIPIVSEKRQKSFKQTPEGQPRVIQSKRGSSR